MKINITLTDEDAELFTLLFPRESARRGGIADVAARLLSEKLAGVAKEQARWFKANEQALTDLRAIQREKIAIERERMTLREVAD